MDDDEDSQGPVTRSSKRKAAAGQGGGRGAKRVR